MPKLLISLVLCYFFGHLAGTLRMLLQIKAQRKRKQEHFEKYAQRLKQPS
jgi:hypothetical protein